MFGLGRFFRRSTGLERHYGPVTVHDRPLRCLVCRHDAFWEHHVQLHTPGATFYNLEFLNRVANCAVCASCGYVHFFVPTNAAPAAASEDNA